jgi:sphingomyelin phosphodiesterase acid-like 3
MSEGCGGARIRLCAPALALALCLAAFLPPAPCHAGLVLGWDVSPTSGTGAYLLLSDIHFDPFVDPALVPALFAAPAKDWDSILAKTSRTAFPGITDDTNWPLWHSALAALKAPGLPYDYAIITGDIQAHKFTDKFAAFKLGDQAAYEGFVRKTLLYVNLSLQAALPGTPLYWTLGNNDSECGDYGIVPGGLLISHLAQDWTEVASDPAAAQDFVKDGYYETGLPGNAGRFIGLNTIAWSRHLNTTCSDPKKDPGAAELDWLRAHLAADAQAGAKVVLAMHIPPGLNAFKSQCGLPQEAFFKPEDQAPFLDLLAQYSASIRMLYAGHTHFDDLKVFSRQGRALAAVHLTPSIGPNHGNNPSFQIGLYRRADGALQDLATYTLRNLSAADARGTQGLWSFEYGFKQAYGQDFDLAGLDAVAKAIHGSNTARSLYEAFYAGETSSQAALQSSEWLPYSCAQTCFSPEEFVTCACADRDPE